MDYEKKAREVLDTELFKMHWIPEHYDELLSRMIIALEEAWEEGFHAEDGEC